MSSSPPANASSPPNTTATPIPGAAVGMTLLGVAVAVGLPGNAVVLWSYAAARRRTVPVLLIFHLAVADMVTLLTGPIYLRALSVGQWEMGLSVCRGCHYVCAAAMYVSVFLIALLGLHRCLAVSRPVAALVTPGGHAGRLAHGVAALMWLVASILAIPSIVFRRVQEGHCQRVHSTRAWLVAHNLLETTLGWALPLATVAVGYGLLVRRLRQTHLSQRGRTFRLVAAVVVAFAVSWGPYHLANLLEVAVVLQGGGGTLEAASKVIRPPATALAFLSSAMNPFLYACVGWGLRCRARGGLLPRLLDISAIAGSSQGTTAKGTQMEVTPGKVKVLLMFMGLEGSTQNLIGFPFSSSVGGISRSFHVYSLGTVLDNKLVQVPLHDILSLWHVYPPLSLVTSAACRGCTRSHYVTGEDIKHHWSQYGAQFWVREGSGKGGKRPSPHAVGLFDTEDVIVVTGIDGRWSCVVRNNHLDQKQAASLRIPGGSEMQH
ncbi:leukotriene B4 receptor 1-like [Porphyrio hochstetteri]